MRSFYLLALSYLTLAVGLSSLVAPENGDSVFEGVAAVIAYSMFTARALMWLAPLIVVGLVLVPRAHVSDRLRQAAAALVMTVVLQLGYSVVKSSIPDLVPFWADPPLAAAERAILGADAWQIAHRLAPVLPDALVTGLYMFVWALCALTFPVLLGLFDHDRARRSRMLALYVLCWIGIGNLLALTFASVGPVFHDGTYGLDRFAALDAALRAPGTGMNGVGRTQDYLWQAYASGRMPVASGISAFPSVHVAMATLVAIYCGERWRFARIPGALFVAAILFLSVWTGYHYLADGLASIALMLAFHLALRQYVRPDRAVKPAIALVEAPLAR